MTKKRIATSAAFAAGLICLTAASGSARAAGYSPSASQIPAPATLASPQSSAAAEDDFAGLDLSDEQKAQIAKIHQTTEAHKAIVAKDTKLTDDQKNAFLIGYTRQEYGEMFRVLTPLQQKSVRKKMEARRAADQAAHKKQAAPPKPR